MFLDDDALPTTDLSLRLKDESDQAAWLVGRLSLEELWRFVDRVRVGEAGYALVYSADQRLIAHGDPVKKRMVALFGTDQAAPLQESDVLTGSDQSAPTFFKVFDDRVHGESLATGARVPELNWTAMVVQPTSEAFAVSNQMQGQLLAAIGLSLIFTVVLGWLWARSFITRIFALKAATQAIAEGRMDERVVITGSDEIHQLGDSFNAMADRLVELQEDVRKQERQAMFGRIAAGLVHDLSHPIQNIGNSCKLIVKMFDDLEYRETFKRTVDREMVMIKRVLDDLRNIARPIPLERFPVEIQRSVGEAVESMQQHADDRRHHAAVRAGRRAGVHRRRRVRAGPGLPESDPERDPGDRPRRPDHGRHRDWRGAGAGAGAGHRLRHPGRSPDRDFRRLRHHQAAGTRARAGDFPQDRRSARRPDPSHQ